MTDVTEEEIFDQPTPGKPEIKILTDKAFWLTTFQGLNKDTDRQYHLIQQQINDVKDTLDHAPETEKAILSIGDEFRSLMDCDKLHQWAYRVQETLTKFGSFMDRPDIDASFRATQKAYKQRWHKYNTILWKIKFYKEDYYKSMGKLKRSMIQRDADVDNLRFITPKEQSRMYDYRDDARHCGKKYWNAVQKGKREKRHLLEAASEFQTTWIEVHTRRGVFVMETLTAFLESVKYNYIKNTESLCQLKNINIEKVVTELASESKRKIFVLAFEDYADDFSATLVLQGDNLPSRVPRLKTESDVPMIGEIDDTEHNNTEVNNRSVVRENTTINNATNPDNSDVTDHDNTKTTNPDNDAIGITELKPINVPDKADDDDGITTDEKQSVHQQDEKKSNINLIFLARDNKDLDVSLMSGVKVLAVKEYNKQKRDEISLKPGMILRQICPADADGMAYGSYRKHPLAKKKGGMYPADYVVLYSR